MPGNNTASASGFYTTSTSANVEFKNNIITITRTGAGQKFGFNVASGDVVVLSLDKNDYYINGPGGNNYIGFRNSARATLAEWQSVTNRDLNSFTIDPVYANMTSGNLQPTIAPLNNNGDALSVFQQILIILPEVLPLPILARMSLCQRHVSVELLQATQ